MKTERVYSKRLDIGQGAASESNRSVCVIHEDCEPSGNTADNSSAKSIERSLKEALNLTWQTQLAQAVTDPLELLRILNLSPELAMSAKKAAQLFPLRVPHSFISRMKKGDIKDPLLRQVLPIHAELENVSGFSGDPLDERAANPIPGLLHKYDGRVLLILSGACGVNCRFCFRREFPYQDNNPGSEGWEKALEYVQQDVSIREVILSGGDPLVVPDRRLKQFFAQLAEISHVKTVRIHSRMPIVLPDRITPEFLSTLAETRLRCVLVLHTNHAQEIDHTVAAAIKKVRNEGGTVLNQSVLLRGINDSAEALIALSERLFDIGVLPYYLHLLDKVQGSAHFEVDESTARQLMLDITKKLPGYLVPRLVREEAGAMSKQQVML